MSIRTSASQSTALGAVLGVAFLTFLDTTIVSVALGDLATDVSAGVIPLQWVVNAYALAFATLMLTGGALADRYGRRRLMLAGLGVFCVGSAMCALAPGVALVIAGRVVMGVGAAAAEPGTLSIIRQLFPELSSRARALGAWSAVSGLALALGPVLGGLLVDAGDWRSIFWFNLAAGVVLCGWVALAVPESADPGPGRLDVAGVVLGAAGVGCVVFAAIAGEYRGFGSPQVVALFAIGATCLVMFSIVEWRAPFPMLDPAHLRPPIVRVALFAAFAIYFAVFAIFFLTALYLDIGQRYSGARLAAMFAPMAAAIVIGGLAAGPWVARRGARWPMSAGCALAAIGMAVARVELGEQRELSFAALASALALAGFGFGVTVVPLTSSVLSHVPARHSGIAASMTNTARQLGAVVGVAALGAIVNSRLADAVNREFSGKLLGPSRKPALRILETGGGGGGFSFENIPKVFVTAFVDGVRLALLIAIAFTLVAGLAAAITPQRSAPDGEAHATPVS